MPLVGLCNSMCPRGRGDFAITSNKVQKKAALEGFYSDALSVLTTQRALREDAEERKRRNPEQPKHNSSFNMHEVTRAHSNWVVI